MFNWFKKKEEPKKVKPEFTPIYFEEIGCFKFNTRQELEINKAKAKKKGFKIKWGDYYGCGWYMNLYRDPRRKKHETVR